MGQRPGRSPAASTGSLGVWYHPHLRIGRHMSLLEPVVPALTVLAWEQERGIVLPVSHRKYLTEVATGGPGPGYGIFPLGFAGDSAHDSKPWTIEQLGEPGHPFPHDRAWNLSRERLTPPEGLSDDEQNHWFADLDRILLRSSARRRIDSRWSLRMRNVGASRCERESLGRSLD